MDVEAIAIGGMVLVPLIVGLIEVLKRFFPHAHGNVWLGVSIALGMAGQVVVTIFASELPATLEQWAALVVLGLNFALAASKAYDESIGRSPS